MSEIKNPSDYGLTHTEFRPHQREAIEWCATLASGQVGVLGAPTGSGKTGIARALAHMRGAIALCGTKALQAENYGEEYKFDVLFGRRNYPCIHPDNSDAMTDDCLFRDEGMNKCDCANDCPYLQKKRKAEASPAASLNYAYWLAARWPRQKLEANGRGILVCDEAHQLSDITLEHAGCKVTEREREKFDLPRFGNFYSDIRFMDKDQPIDKALAWLIPARAAAERAEKVFESNNDERHARQAERTAAKLEATIVALRLHGEDWYIASGPKAISDEQGSKLGFVCRPLTARYHFPYYFVSDQWSLLAMSATIGDPQTFANELGLGVRNTDWKSRNIPSVWNPETRPVQVLDAPRMGVKSTEKDYLRQAEVIASAINDCPREWSGMIHVTRKPEAKLVAQRLARHGLGERLWTPNELHSTNETLEEWNAHRKNVKGALAISWQFWEGYNGLDEKICIVAKTPFASLGDPYERERMDYSGTFYLQRAAYKLEQGLGRTRRGRTEDYDVNGQINGLVAIADQNYRRVQKYLSPALRESLVE